MKLNLLGVSQDYELCVSDVITKNVLVDSGFSFPLPHSVKPVYLSGVISCLKTCLEFVLPESEREGNTQYFCASNSCKMF